MRVCTSYRNIGPSSSFLWMSLAVTHSLVYGAQAGRPETRLQSRSPDSIASKRHQVLPAYTQNGVIHTRIIQGSTDGEVFEDFIKELLPLCGRWPEPNSVHVMDNASFHQSASIKELCDEAGVILHFLSPYSPDLNPIEELFSQLKAFIRRHWRQQAHNYDNFGDFLTWALSNVGSDMKSAQGHFRNSGLSTEQP